MKRVLLSAFCLLSSPIHAKVRPVALGSTEDPRLRCAGILISARQILTVAHCVRELEAPTVVADLGRIAKVRTFHADPLSYPDHDWAVLELAAPFSGPIGLTMPLLKAQGKASMVALVRRPGQRDWQVEPLGKAMPLGIPGMPALFKIQSEGQEKFCVGDSGSPVFQREGGSLKFWGLINGDWPPLTGPRTSCLKTVVASQAAEALPWAQVEPKTPTPVEEAVWLDIRAACRERTLENEQGVLVQDLFNQLLENELPSLGTLEYCDLVQQKFSQGILGSAVLTLEASRSIRGLSFLKPWKRWRLVKPGREPFLEFINLVEPVELSLEGAPWTFSSGPTPLEKIRRLSIKYQSLSENFYAWLGAHRELEELELVGVSVENKPLKLANLNLPLSMKSLSIRYSKVCCESFKTSGYSAKIHLHELNWVRP